MSHMHYVPGRLRVRITDLKRNPTLARAVEQRLRQLPGVRSADANPLTGSVVVLYDPATLTATTLMSAFREWGYEVAVPKRRPEPAVRLSSHQFAHKAAEAVAWHVLEKAVERSLPVLIAALL